MLYLLASMRRRLGHVAPITQNLAFLQLGMSTWSSPTPHVVIYFRGRIDMIQFQVFPRPALRTRPVRIEPLLPAARHPLALPFALNSWVCVRHGQQPSVWTLPRSSGRSGRGRTDNLTVPNRVLCLLSYAPKIRRSTGLNYALEMGDLAAAAATVPVIVPSVNGYGMLCRRNPCIGQS